MLEPLLQRASSLGNKDPYGCELLFKKAASDYHINNVIDFIFIACNLLRYLICYNKCFAKLCALCMLIVSYSWRSGM